MIVCKKLRLCLPLCGQGGLYMSLTECAPGGSAAISAGYLTGRCVRIWRVRLHQPISQPNYWERKDSLTAPERVVRLSLLFHLVSFVNKSENASTHTRWYQLACYKSKCVFMVTCLLYTVPRQGLQHRETLRSRRPEWLDNLL